MKQVKATYFILFNVRNTEIGRRVNGKGFFGRLKQTPLSKEGSGLLQPQENAQVKSNQIFMCFELPVAGNCPADKENGCQLPLSLFNSGRPNLLHLE